MKGEFKPKEGSNWRLMNSGPIAGIYYNMHHNNVATYVQSIGFDCVTVITRLYYCRI